MSAAARVLVLGREQRPAFNSYWRIAIWVMLYISLLVLIAAKVLPERGRQPGLLDA